MGAGHGFLCWQTLFLNLFSLLSFRTLQSRRWRSPASAWRQTASPPCTGKSLTCRPFLSPSRERARLACARVQETAKDAMTLRPHFHLHPRRSCLFHLALTRTLRAACGTVLCAPSPTLRKPGLCWRPWTWTRPAQSFPSPSSSLTALPVGRRGKAWVTPSSQLSAQRRLYRWSAAVWRPWGLPCQGASVPVWVRVCMCASPHFCWKCDCHHIAGSPPHLTLQPRPLLSGPPWALKTRSRSGMPSTPNLSTLGPSPAPRTPRPCTLPFNPWTHSVDASTPWSTRRLWLTSLTLPG